MSKKTDFNTTDEQLDRLEKALAAGSPLLLALQYAGISRATYYYWVAVASVVEQAKSQEELERLERAFKTGISIQDVRDLSESDAAKKRTGVGTFIEPSEESVLQYKNNKRFKEFADKCYEVVNRCNTIRSQVALDHLDTITKSTDKGSRINASGSMWFLERTLSDFFAKPSDKVVDAERPSTIEPVRVEYVNPKTKESLERIKNIEEDLERNINGEGKA